MKLIDKYLIREFLAMAFYCLAGFSMLFIVSEVSGDMEKLVRLKPPPLLIARFYISLLGPYLQFLTPASLMLATIYTLYTMTRNNELTAMRASGISIYRIMMPFMLVGLVFSLALGALGEFWIPNAAEWVEEMRANKFKTVQTKVVDQCIYLNQDAGRQWIINDFDTKHPRVLNNVEIKQERPDGTREYVVRAPKARYLDGQWWFFGAEIRHYGTNDNPRGDFMPLGARTNSAVQMRDYHEYPSEFVSSVRPWEFLNAREMYRYLEANKNQLSKRARAKKEYGIHSQIAMPLACFIVIMFAIPVGARTGRQGAMAAVFAAIALLAGFYALSQMGLILGSRGTIPPAVGAWLANGVFFVVGFVMMLRMR